MKIEITGESLKKLMPLWLWIGCWLSAYGTALSAEAHNSFLFVLFSIHAFVLGIAAITKFLSEY